MEKAAKKGPESVLEMLELFDATPERVFKAWTSKKDFVSWYGPEGFTVPFCEMDVRVGGKWRACIKSPQGDEYWMQGKYIEITSPSRLVFTYGDGSEKPQMGETLESAPSCLNCSVGYEQAVPACENVHQKLAVFCIKGCRSFRDATTRFAPLELSRKEETGVGFH